MMMKPSLAAALLLMTLGGYVHAAGPDFVFEAVDPDVPTGDRVPIEIRLVDKTGKPVSGALIVRARLDMAPDGMAEHTSTIKPEGAGAQPGVYAFNANFTMSGQWQLSVAAKVQGEPQTVVGKIIFKAKEPPREHEHSSHHH